jgi:5-formyltetrahydrofolate cyclo-ligase
LFSSFEFLIFSLVFDSKPESICVICPGLGFNLKGERLGKGGGYYDRFLKKLKEFCPKVTTIGVCFDFQLVDEIPMDEKDQKIDFICVNKIDE